MRVTAGSTIRPLATAKHRPPLALALAVSGQWRPEECVGGCARNLGGARHQRPDGAVKHMKPPARRAVPVAAGPLAGG